MSIDLEAGPGRSSGTPGPAGAKAPASEVRLRRLARRGRLDIKLSPYGYIAPFFALFAVFGLFPLGYTLWVSLRDWDLVGGDQGFVGWRNYSTVLHDSWFWNSVRNTFGIFVVSTVPQLLLALVLAYLLNKRMRGRTVLRMGILVPNITSTAAVAIVFGQLFGRDFGLVNYLLRAVGVDHAIDWKANVWSSWVAISTMVDWRWTGYNALIFLAAMQTIPRDLYESAALDGASPWLQFWKITVPQIRPTIIFAVIISTIGGLQLFTEPLLFNGGANAIYGGSLRQSQTITMYLYEQAFTRFHFGVGSAVAWLLFLIILVVALVNVALVSWGARSGEAHPLRLGRSRRAGG
jgi:cellobiose transport system permease protein